MPDATALNVPVLAARRPGEPLQAATLLEVRYSSTEGGVRRARSPDAGSSSPSAQMLAFLRWSGGERRFASWVPAESVSAPVGSRLRIAGPTINEAAREPISAEVRQRLRARGDLEFLEERLKRDVAAPTLARRLHYAGYAMRPWYYSPLHVLYPDFAPTRDAPLPDCHVCPFTLSMFASPLDLRRHVRRLHEDGAALRPPGRETYRDASCGVAIYQFEGIEAPEYARNVFLLSKSFLENKLVGHDVALYTFHVITLDVGGAPGTAAREGGARIFAGYFTVEKSAPEHNLACIVVLPCFQGRGLGRLLIAHSYEVSRRRCRIDPTASVGTPERPLSDLGQAMYHRFWDACVWRWAATRSAALSQAGPGATGGVATMKEIAAEIELAPEDVRDAVMRLGLLHRTESKALRLLLPRSVAEAAVARGQGRGPHYRSDLYLGA